MTVKYINKQLIENFKNRKYFSRKELYGFYKRYEPDLNKNTFAWRIYDLKTKNMIREIKKNTYSLSDKTVFTPKISKTIAKLNSFIKKEYRNPDYDIWETRWLYSFLIHQPAINLIIIDLPKDLEESVFYNIKDIQKTDIYFNPGKKEIEKYIFEKKEAIIIKPLITRAPLKKIKDVSVPKLEKILVDIFSEQEIFLLFSGSEMNNIFNFAFENFQVNLTTLLNYAARRNKREDIIKYINLNVRSKEKELIK